MKIVHFSDIHLSYENYDDLKFHFLDALKKDLHKNSINDNDLIIITGDLVDRGGNSIKNIDDYKKSSYESPFEFFKDVFIEPLKEEFRLENKNFLFIPGNHDVNENNILWVDEKEMKDKINQGNINDYLIDNRDEINNNNERIKDFKEFEKEFHKDTDKYNFSYNQSTFSYKSNQEDLKIGFLLINDSWRCSTCEVIDDEKNAHYFGSKQLHLGLENLKSELNHITICLFHHPTEIFKEKEDVERILKNKPIQLYLFGHSHKVNYSGIISQNAWNKCFGIGGKATLNRANETHIDYTPGYQIIEVVKDRIVCVKYRTYDYENYHFIDDTKIASDGGVDYGNQRKGYILIDSEESLLDSTEIEKLKEDSFR